MIRAIYAPVLMLPLVRMEMTKTSSPSMAWRLAMMALPVPMKAKNLKQKTTISKPWRGMLKAPGRAMSLEMHEAANHGHGPAASGVRPRATGSSRKPRNR